LRHPVQEGGRPVDPLGRRSLRHRRGASPVGGAHAGRGPQARRRDEWGDARPALSVRGLTARATMPGRMLKSPSGDPPAMPQASHPYSVHPSVQYVRNWIDTLRQKTGRSLDEWLQLVEEQGPATVKERTAWLKSEHGLGTNSAMWIA